MRIVEHHVVSYGIALLQPLFISLFDSFYISDTCVRNIVTSSTYNLRGVNTI